MQQAATQISILDEKNAESYKTCLEEENKDLKSEIRKTESTKGYWRISTHLH